MESPDLFANGYAKHAGPLGYQRVMLGALALFSLVYLPVQDTAGAAFSQLDFNP